MRMIARSLRHGMLSALLAVAACPSFATADDGPNGDRGQLERLEEQAFQQAAALADPSIVRIETVGGLDLVGQVLTGTGPTTGVVVSEDGYIITSSFNFVSNPSSVLVQLQDERRFPAEIVSQDRARMLTLLKIEAQGLIPLEAVPKEEIFVGQWSIALGRTYENSFPNISVGIISAVGRIWGRAVQTDAKISPVNYGGPLVDVSGRCLGVLVPLQPDDTGETAGLDWYDGGIGFAIPMSDIYAVLDRLKTGEDLQPGLLGVSFVDQGPLAGEAKIQLIRPLSPADQAGLQVDDVIIEFNGQPVERVPLLRHLLGAHYAGDTVNVVVRRGEETITADITLSGQLQAVSIGFLGILPQRMSLAETTPGVVIREVIPASPAAAAGLQEGDRIIAVNGSDMHDADQLRSRLARATGGEALAIDFVRDGVPNSCEVMVGTYPAEVIDQLSTFAIPSAPEGSRPEGLAVGRITESLPGDERRYWAYIPDQYNPEYEYGLVVWLHPDRETMEADVFRAWQLHCDRRGIILLAPMAPDAAWSGDQTDYINSLVESFQQRYRIDPRRIVAHGMGQGGELAFDLVFRHRDIYSAGLVISAPLRQLPAEGESRKVPQFLLLTVTDSPEAELVQQTHTLLGEMKLPVSLVPFEQELPGYPPEETVETMVRWVDSLDRI